MSNLNVATPDAPTSTLTYVLVGAGIFIGLILIVVIMWAIISAANSRSQIYSSPQGVAGYSTRYDPALLPGYDPSVASMINTVAYDNPPIRTYQVGSATNDPRNSVFPSKY